MSDKYPVRQTGPAQSRVNELRERVDAYAHHRTIPILVSMVIFLLFFICIGVSSRFGGEAFRAGHRYVGSLLMGSGCLFAVLYAIHALLYISGAPVRFRNPWEVLDMVISTFGYGILTALLGHLYSRYALRRLKACARAMPELAGNHICPDMISAEERGHESGPDNS